MPANSKELRTVNLQHGRPPSAKQPLCPNRSKRAVKLLEKEGENHSEPGHICEKCSCDNAAGKGTGHVGYGLCSQCEKTVTKEYATRVAREHLNALQSHQPFIYREPDKWLEQVQQQGASASRRIELDAEFDVARSLVQKLIANAQLKNRPTDQALLEKIEQVEELLDIAQDGEALELLREIRTLLTCNLTVNTARGLQPMSDDRQIKLVTGLVKSIGAIGLARHRISQSDSYSKDEVRKMFARFATLSQEAIMNPDPDRTTVWKQYVNKLASAERSTQ